MARKIDDKNKIKNEDEIQKYIIPFYTTERWQNWINKVKESNFKIDDKEKSVVFVYMTDDVVLACLKVIAKYDKGILNKEEAKKFLSDIKEIVLKKIEPIDEDIDVMLDSTQLSLMVVFASCELYINNAFDRTKLFDKLIKNAIQAEEQNDMDTALNNIATIGANILAGEKLKDKDLDISSEGLVAEWVDGIDSLTVAMMGDTSYKYDEPDEE